MKNKDNKYYEGNLLRKWSLQTEQYGWYLTTFPERILTAALFAQGDSDTKQWYKERAEEATVDTLTKDFEVEEKPDKADKVFPNTKREWEGTDYYKHLIAHDKIKPHLDLDNGGQFPLSALPPAVFGKTMPILLFLKFIASRNSFLTDARWKPTWLEKVSMTEEQLEDYGIKLETLQKMNDHRVFGKWFTLRPDLEDEGRWYIDVATSIAKPDTTMGMGWVNITQEGIEDKIMHYTNMAETIINTAKLKAELDAKKIKMV